MQALRRVLQPSRMVACAVGRRQLSSVEQAGAKATRVSIPGLTAEQLDARHSSKLEELNKWILQEERDYLALKGESKSLDDISGPAPLKLYGVSGRYATGLYNSAVRAKELGKVEADLKKIVSTAKSSKALMNFIASPTIGRADRLKGTASIASSLSLCTTTKNFLGVLAASTRTKYLFPIANNFSLLTAAASGQLTVTLTAPSVLSDMEEKDIVTEIKKEFMPWQTVRIVRKYDPELIAGYIVDYGDKIQDKSYGSKLKKIKAALSGVAGPSLD